MKLTLISFCLAVLLIGVHSAPQYFELNGMKGVVDSSSKINGEETDGDSYQRFTKAEEIIKAMIQKQLDSRKQAKKAARQSKHKAPGASEPVAKSPVITPEDLSKLSINWDEKPQARDLLNERVPGGTASVDALIKLIKEQNAQK